jgi:IS30 family transposase
MPKGYHHVTREQRSQISALKAIATPLNKIAQVMGLSPSSVCQELKRNTGKRGYRYKQADNVASVRQLELD